MSKQEFVSSETILNEIKGYAIQLADPVLNIWIERLEAALQNESQEREEDAKDRDAYFRMYQRSQMYR